MKRLWNDQWEFSKQPLFTTLAEMETKQEQFAPIGIPHDWLIYNAKDLYEDSTGWYRKKLNWKKQLDENVFLYFEGIYMDSHIYVNPAENPTPVFEWKYGYSTFEVDLTPWLKDGENEIWVSVDYRSPNTRWYSGAGIYRNVWLKTVHETHFISDGIYFHTEKTEDDIWNIEISAEIKTSVKTEKNAIGENYIEKKEEQSSDGQTLASEISGAEKENTKELQLSVEFILKEKEGSYSLKLGEVPADTFLSAENGAAKAAVSAQIKNPKIWDLGHPNCYELCVLLKKNEEILQEEVLTVGFRTTLFDPEQGFVLNGRKVKLYGVCEHHDLGCLGSAFHPQAMRRKMEILKEMGVNAIRTSHNMPAPELMELADEMGILIVSEAFDMWESSKTAYDYARFFPEWYKKDVASWVRRDRNHPSVILWSIGNEIHDTHASERGQMWTRALIEEVKKSDSLGNALPTIGSNYMPWENAQKCADIIKIAGYNYGPAYYDDHHEKHPDWIIYGSETSSVVQSRGIYHFPFEKSILCDEDEQCSDLGNSTTSWGAKSAEACIIAERDHPYSAGQFLWSGFDYIGEPTPYHTRNSYFGQIDTAGFPKDSFYAYQAAWTKPEEKTILHLFPYWDFNEGQNIDVRTYTNADKVELFVNGRSQGVCEIDHEHGEVLSGNWKVPYEKGEIHAVAYDAEGNILAEDSRHSFGDAAEINLKLSSDELHADGKELLFIEISMKDADGYPVENANNRVEIEVNGAGSLVGMDNGDSTDTDEYKCSSKRLFSGKLLAVVKAGTESGKLEISVKSAGLPEKRVSVNVLPGQILEGYSDLAYKYGTDTKSVQNESCPDTAAMKKVSLEKTHYDEVLLNESERDIPVRNIYLTSAMGTNLNPDNPYAIVHAQIRPANASDQEVLWCVVDDTGIPSILADLEPDGYTVKVTAKSDGKFRLRCMSKCGTEKVRIISQMEFSVEGMGEAFFDPYGFVTGGLYDYSVGEITNGNEHGVSTARDGESHVGFHNLDFGPYGSDEICIPVFALSGDPYRIQIYEGMPGEEGAELIGDVIYQKPTIWNVYQEETYKLKKRLKGITSICFVMTEKVHIKGFSFTRKNRALEQLFAGECDQVYGDTFEKDGEWLRGIGNNVSLIYKEMDFGIDGVSRITIFGNTPLDKNMIILNVRKNGEDIRSVLEFTQKEGSQSFEIEPLTDQCEVQFIFLPGSNFDFRWFRFE